MAPPAAGFPSGRSAYPGWVGSTKRARQKAGKAARKAEQARRARRARIRAFVKTWIFVTLLLVAVGMVVSVLSG